MSTIEIELSDCHDCEVCISACPVVFQRNEAGGYIEAKEMKTYPIEDVNEAIKDCPADCISWQ